MSCFNRKKVLKCTVVLGNYILTGDLYEISRKTLWNAQ